jgi:hypothetical protein
MFDSVNWKGIIDIDVLDEHNNIIESYRFENLITKKGKLYLAKMIGSDISGINKIGMGTLNTPTNVEDLTLGNKIVLIDVSRDYSIENVIRFIGKVEANTFSSNVVYQEIGLVYKSLSEEILITRAVFSTPITQKFTNSLSVSYALTIV